MSEKHHFAHVHFCLINYIDNSQGGVSGRGRALGDRDFSSWIVVNKRSVTVPPILIDRQRLAIVLRSAIYECDTSKQAVEMQTAARRGLNPASPRHSNLVASSILTAQIGLVH